MICGAAGVGKSTVAWEIGSQLQVAEVRHALIDTDELDRVFPQPQSLPELVALSSRNLAALWESFAALGHSRLILSGVMLDLDSDLAWIRASIGNADYTVVRLVASDETLRQRVGAREIGSGRVEQTKRTLTQAKVLRDRQDERSRFRPMVEVRWRSHRRFSKSLDGPQSNRCKRPITVMLDARSVASADGLDSWPTASLASQSMCTSALLARARR